MILAQNSKFKTQKRNLKLKIFYFLLALLPFAFCLLPFFGLSSIHAEDITILYTGATHAMLYPCNCPEEVDGGIARRATLINQLRKKNPHTLLLDAGSFFAGGLFDEYTQNTQLDMHRATVNSRAMELMGYDAVAIGADELNFGKAFLQGQIKKTKLNFLSSNIRLDSIKPYIIKKVAGKRIGIIGVTNLIAKQKAAGLDFVDPKAAIQDSIKELLEAKVDLVVLLSNLGESHDSRLLSNIKGIDILVTIPDSSGVKPVSKIDSTIIVPTSWQARRLGKLNLELDKNKIIDYEIEELRVSDKFKDNSAILAILPRCFSDFNCKKEGRSGTCRNPGTTQASCVFEKTTKIKLMVIRPSSCITCNPANVIKFLKRYVPGLEPVYINYPGRKAKKLIKDFEIRGLPAYILEEKAEEEKTFEAFKNNLQKKGSLYMLKQEVAGFSYFLNRKKIKGRLDLFISLHDKDSYSVLKAAKEFKPKVHFLAIEKNDGFNTKEGNLELEECLRSVCLQKYYPNIFWNYISCRAKNINTSWWEDCLGKGDAKRIKACARTEEGLKLLKDNTDLNKELQIIFGPTYLLDNQEVFTTRGAPDKKELEIIIKSKK